MASVAETVGDKRFGGEEVRIIDLSANAHEAFGIYTSGVKTKEEAGKLSDKLKHASLRYYGTPFKAFMKGYLGSLSKKQRYERAKHYLDQFLEAAKKNKRVAFHHRFAKRFAVVYAAGALASDFKVLDWKHEMIFNTMMELYITASHERGSTQASQLQKVVKLVRRKLHATKGFINHSGNSAIQANKSTFDNHRGVKLLDEHGNIEVIKVQREVLRDWCGSKRMTDAAIDWFIENDFMQANTKRYQGEQKPHWRLEGKSAPNRPRYFTFSPNAAKSRKKPKKRI